jgi:hypothetical protein
MAKVSANIENPICVECSTLFDEDDFFCFKGGEYIPYCKSCCENLVTNDFGELDINLFNALLKKINKAFFYDIWKEVQSETDSPFEDYLKLLDKTKRAGKKFKDSDTIENNENLKVDTELLEKWGVASMDDVELLEKEYHEWETSYEIDSKAMIDSVKQLCLVELDIRKARAKSDVQALDKLLRIKSQILGDANLKPVQETGNAANEQVSIGMLIKKFEQEEPIPEINEPDWIDEMKMWIVGQLARMEGLQSDVTDDFNKELSKYGIDMEINEEQGDI